MSHPVRRRIIGSLQNRDLSFTELLNAVGSSNHGRLGFHLRALKDFVELETSTRKYHLTNRGYLLARVIQDFHSISWREQIYREYAGNLTLGDHAFALYAEENFKRKILFPFLKAGLLRGEAVVHLMSEHKLDTETREIQRFGIDLENLRKGAFTIMSAYKWYLEKGKAQAKAIIANWVKLLNEKKKAGFRGIHASGDMDVLFDYARIEELLEYEESLGRQLTIDICGLCLYNRERLDKSHIARLINYHGHIISKDIVGKT
jgi:hypothetical protein